jgi:ethanolamine ammonia-lyase small subunit
MARDRDDELARRDGFDLIERIRARTPARLLAGRSGGSYRTETQLELRAAHAAAADAVRAELSLNEHLSPALVKQFGLFEVSTCARDKAQYLLRPDLGRKLNDAARERVRSLRDHPDLQIAIGDGLSVTAVAAQVPQLLPLLMRGAQQRGWSVGQAFVIRYCRVGVLNDIGELVAPKVAVLLIGERPGLATAESLSAYLAYAPRAGHTDADRNLISNIHARGVAPPVAAERILRLAAEMMRLRLSGTNVKESFGALESG